jgi:two-component system aerobic respiration control sensor histidine kinase ArcB
MLDQYLYFDIKIINELYGDDCYQLINEFLGCMVTQIPYDNREMMDAYAAKDWDKIEQLAHRIKGEAAACGTLRLKYACQYLERYRKASYSKSLEKLYYQLIKRLDETKDYIEKWLKMGREV